MESLWSSVVLVIVFFPFASICSFTRKWWVSVDFISFLLFILKLFHFSPTGSSFRCQIYEMPERILHFLIEWSPSIMDTSECKLLFIHCHCDQCYLLYIATHKWFPGGSDDKESACNERDPDQSLDWKDLLEKYRGPVPVGSRVFEVWTARRERYIDTERDKERICS